MILLDTTTKSLQILLGGAVTTNELVYVAGYADLSSSGTVLGESDGLTNGTTAVTPVSAPAASTVRKVTFLNVYNNDSVDATLTVRINNNGTFRKLVTITLSSGSVLVMTNDAWKVVTSAGETVVSTADGVGTHQLLDSTVHTDTTTGTVARGDIITGQGGTPSWTRLAKGTAGQFLRSDGTDVAWGVDGSALTTLNASNLSSGTVPDGRFPATLPAASGVNLTALNASELGSGTVPLARLSGITNTEIAAGAAIAASKLALNAGTSDGSDNSNLSIAGGGALGGTRGGSITVAGNEHATQPGYVLTQIGNVTGSKFSIQRSDNVEVVNISGADGIEALRFAAAQVASADANTLDDYEEGSWTPVLGGSTSESGQTYSIQVGRYLKVGRKVTIHGRIVFSAKGTITGSLRLKGLPFAPANVGNGYSGLFNIPYSQGVAWSNPQAGGYFIPNVSEIEVVAQTTSGSGAQATANITDTTDIIFGGTYLSGS